MSNPRVDFSGNDSGTKEFIYKNSPDDKDHSADNLKPKKQKSNVDLIDSKYGRDAGETNGSEWIDCAVHCYT